MSAPGFPYYKSEVGRYQDMKIKRLKREFKGEGVAIHDYIVAEIFKDKGCYVICDDNLIFDVAEYWAVSESRVKEVINYCCHVGLFNKELLAKERVLSSKGIQLRFLLWSEQCKRKNYKVPEEYYLITEEIPKVTEEYIKRTEENDIVESNIVKNSRVSACAPAAPNFDDVFLFFKGNSEWDKLFCEEKTKLFMVEYSENFKKLKFDWESKAKKWIITEYEHKVGDGKREKKYPDYYDKNYASKLENEDLKKYWAHCRNLNWTTYKDDRGNTVWVEPGGFTPSIDKENIPVVLNNLANKWRAS